MCASVVICYITRDPCLNLQTLDSIGQSVFGYDFKALDSKTKTPAQQAFMALTNRRSIRFVSLTQQTQRQVRVIIARYMYYIFLQTWVFEYRRQ